MFLQIEQNEKNVPKQLEIVIYYIQSRMRIPNDHYNGNKSSIKELHAFHFLLSSPLFSPTPRQMRGVGKIIGSEFTEHSDTARRTFAIHAASLIFELISGILFFVYFNLLRRLVRCMI